MNKIITNFNILLLNSQILLSNFSILPTLTIKFTNNELHAYREQIAVGIWKLRNNSSQIQKILEWKRYAENFDDLCKNYNINIEVKSNIWGWDDAHKVNYIGIIENNKIIDYFKDTSSTITNTQVSISYWEEFITGGTEAETIIHSYADDNFLFLYTEAIAGGGGASFAFQKMYAEINIPQITFSPKIKF